jgi:hypothetical protein
MSNKESTKRKQSISQPSDRADLDKTERGPSRLYAPGKPHEVESGPSRLRRSLGRHQAVEARRVAFIRPHPEAAVDTTEAGPARLVRFKR